MNKSAKILLVYSIVVSGLLITSGFFFNPNPQNWLLQLIFAPVPIFLLYTLVTRSTELKISKRQLIIAFLIMAILLGLGVSNVQKSQANEKSEDVNDEENITQFSISNAEINEDKKVTDDTVLIVIKADEGAFINVRKEPRVTSVKITVVEGGDRFISTGYEEQWYEVRLDDDTTGYVFEEFVEVIGQEKEENNQ